MDNNRKFDETLFLKESILEKDEVILGIDIGTTLIKICVARCKTLSFEIFNKQELQKVEEFLRDVKDDVTHCSGCGISIRSFQSFFEQILEIKMKVDDSELTTMARGLRFLASAVDRPYFVSNGKKISQVPTKDILIASFGSSGQFLKVGENINDIRMIAANGEGGSSFLGLTRLLTRKNNLTNAEAILLANKGDSWKIDLRIADLKNHSNHLREAIPNDNSKDDDSNYGLYPGDMLSSKFGRVSLNLLDVKDAKVEDISAAVLHSIVSNETRTMYLAAKMENIETVFICGNFMSYQVVKDICRKTVEQCENFLKHKLKLIFIEPIGHLAAIGALAIAFEKIKI